jgi:hypothetical protein
MLNWPEKPPQVSSNDLAVLDVERLNLQPATSLRFVLVAEDNQIPDPGRGESREFLLRIVTDEELRADLLRREIEQRKSFQQAYDAQMSLASEMRELIAVPAGGIDQEQWQGERQNRLINLYRSQRGIGTSVDMVANRFEEFLIEVDNNRLDEETAKIDPDRTLKARFANEIVGPIRFMDENMITAATRGIDNCRRRIADNTEFALSVEDTIATQEAILERMREIMASMESSESFQEAVNRLVEIKRIEEGLLKQIEGSGDTQGLFDDDE